MVQNHFLLEVEMKKKFYWKCCPSPLFWTLYSHCAFSSNLFLKYLLTKKCSPWKVFGVNHPQTPRPLSWRGPRCPEARLSQHYIGQKWHSYIFQISAEKSSQAWYKGFPDLLNEWRGLATWFLQITTPKIV